MSCKKLLTALLALTLLAAVPASAQNVLRIGLNDDPDALDPTISRAYTGRLVFAALCDKLFDVTTDLKIVPQLATGYEWAPDNRSVVLKLRPGVKFHDGEPFNAEAVRFNIERHLTTPGSFRKPEIADVKSVDVLTDLTVRLNLSQPQVPLLAALTDRAGMMVSPKAARELGDKLGTRPVCAGPFKFVERVAQGKIVLDRFADYWDKASIHLDRVEFVPITDSTSRVASLRSGDLHMIERVSPTDLAQIRADSRLKVVGVPELGYQMIPINVNNGPRSKTLADVRVREAIDLAIDRETIVKTVFNNEYIPGNQWVAPTSFYYNAKLPVRKRDVARARQLLREAGQPNLTFTLILPPERDRQEAALIIQAMLAEAGITMNLQTQENVTMLTAGRRGDFEAYFTFWSGRPDPDGNIFSHATCKGAQNDSHWCNADFDALVTRARHVADPAERKKLYDQATEILLKELPRLHLWHRRVFTGFSARVQGFTPHPDGIIRVRGVKLN
ncbi:MAG TPA: ABC transporter substrate-binding protein [Methylomirabilota bacterium]|jgi:peptide/nickel transport system substrate-binding protein|nr:ABC transporter substrate-binding protein [Methylomirabilota bacterium]